MAFPCTAVRLACMLMPASKLLPILQTKADDRSPMTYSPGKLYLHRPELLLSIELLRICSLARRSQHTSPAASAPGRSAHKRRCICAARQHHTGESRRSCADIMLLGAASAWTSSSAPPVSMVLTHQLQCHAAQLNGAQLHHARPAGTL